MTQSYYICNMAIAANIAIDNNVELDTTKQGVFRFGDYQGLALYIDTNIPSSEIGLILITGVGRVKVPYEKVKQIHHVN